MTSKGGVLDECRRMHRGAGTPSRGGGQHEVGRLTLGLGAALCDGRHEKSDGWCCGRPALWLTLAALRELQLLGCRVFGS
jgi:hypothetical protein